MVENKPKRLYRSTHDKMIGGVCGGFAEYTNTDPTLIRVIYILILFLTGIVPCILAYLILWAVIPESPAKK